MDFISSLFQPNRPLSNLTKIQHPYYPVGAEITGYLANTYSVPYLLGFFATGCAVILGSTSWMVKKNKPSIPQSDLLTVLWFVLCGFIHLFFEGYYAYNFRTLGAQNTLFAQLWKEYSLSDSRYLTKNSFVLCMETFTAILWGPLSFAVAYLIATNSPFRHPFQLVVSLGQLYGDVLYYATTVFDVAIHGLRHYRPEAYYFWGYYVFLNLFWIVIPFCLIVSSVKASARAFGALDKVEKSLKGANGAVVASNGQAKAGTKKTR